MLGDEGIQPIGSQLGSSSVELDRANEIALAYMSHFDHGTHKWTPSIKPINFARHDPIKPINPKPTHKQAKSNPKKPKEKPTSHAMPSVNTMKYSSKYKWRVKEVELPNLNPTDPTPKTPIPKFSSKAAKYLSNS